MYLKKRYLELKEKAKEALLKGEMKLYLTLLNDLENFNLILISTNKIKK